MDGNWTTVVVPSRKNSRSTSSNNDNLLLVSKNRPHRRRKHSSIRRNHRNHPSTNNNKYHHLSMSSDTTQHTQQQQQQQPKEEDDFSLDVVVKDSLRVCVQELKQSDMWKKLSSTLLISSRDCGEEWSDHHDDEDDEDDGNKSNSTSMSSIERIVCYGIGNFYQQRLSSPLWQLALAILLREYLSNNNKKRNAANASSCSKQRMIPMEYFEPLMTYQEHVLLESLGIQPFTINERGCRQVQVSGKTLFFMPHCPLLLYTNLFYTNWEYLSNVIVFGNSLTQYLESANPSMFQLQSLKQSSQSEPQSIITKNHEEIAMDENSASSERHRLVNNNDNSKPKYSSSSSQDDHTNNCNHVIEKKRTTEISGTKKEKEDHSSSSSYNNNIMLHHRNLSKALSWALRHHAHKIGLSIQKDGYVPVQEILHCQHSKIKKCHPTLQAIQAVVTENDKQRFKLDYRPRHIYYPNNNHNQQQQQPDIPSSSEDDGTNVPMHTDTTDTTSLASSSLLPLQSSGDTILCIRANQGHSIPFLDPQLLLKPLTCEALRALSCVVHGTNPEAWNIIQHQGLSKMKRTHIHFAKGLVTGKKDQDPTNVVISGMRSNATIHIYINVNKCADDDIEFWESDNGVLLANGNHHHNNNRHGMLPPQYFLYVLDITTGKILMDHRSNPIDESLSLQQQPPPSLISRPSDLPKKTMEHTMQDNDNNNDNNDINRKEEFQSSTTTTKTPLLDAKRTAMTILQRLQPYWKETRIKISNQDISQRSANFEQAFNDSSLIQFPIPTTTTPFLKGSQWLAQRPENVLSLLQLVVDDENSEVL